MTEKQMLQELLEQMKLLHEKLDRVERKVNLIAGEVGAREPVNPYDSAYDEYDRYDLGRLESKHPEQFEGIPK